MTKTTTDPHQHQNHGAIMSLHTAENGAVTLSKERHAVCIQIAYELEALSFVLSGVGKSCQHDAMMALIAVRGVAGRIQQISGVLLAGLDDSGEETDSLSRVVMVESEAEA